MSDINDLINSLLSNPIKNESQFKSALKKLTEAVSKETGISRQRAAREIAYQAFLSRIGKSGIGFILKGGYAIEIRSKKPGRTTVDIDLLFRHENDSGLSERDYLYKILEKALSESVDDFFRFEIERSYKDLKGAPEGGHRFSVNVKLCGANYEKCMVDIALGDPVITPTSNLSSGKHLQKIGIEEHLVETISIEQHLAEKLHALTRPRDFENSRAKDLIDIIVLSRMQLDYSIAKVAVREIFSTYNTHSFPLELDSPPKNWESQWDRLCKESGFEISIIEAWRVAQEVIDEIHSH